jgi:Yersinia/Haemophilus virulence surface antigen
MDKDSERALATKHGARSVVGFSQQNNFCRGYVAWWLRRRIKLGSQGKQSNFFNGGGNHSFNILSPMPGQLFKGTRFVMDNEEKSKPQKLAVAFQGASVLAMNNYIQTGEGPDKRQKPDRKNLVTISRELSGSVNMFKQIFEEQRDCIYLKMKCEGKLDHAVGLDLTKSVTYFDPGLGEFVFDTKDQFFNWWLACYQDRKNPPKPPNSAFFPFEDTFIYWVYMII